MTKTEDRVKSALDSYELRARVKSRLDPTPLARLNEGLNSWVIFLDQVY